MRDDQPKSSNFIIAFKITIGANDRGVKRIGDRSHRSNLASNPRTKIAVVRIKPPLCNFHEPKANTMDRIQHRHLNFADSITRLGKQRFKIAVSPTERGSCSKDWRQVFDFVFRINGIRNPNHEARLFEPVDFLRNTIGSSS